MKICLHGQSFLMMWSISLAHNSLPGTKDPQEWNLSFQMCNCINLQRCKTGTFQSALHHQHSLRWPCWITTSEVKRNVFEELLHLQDITVSSRSKKEKEKEANTRLFQALCLIIQGSLLKPHMISSQKGSPQPLGQRMQHFIHTHLWDEESASTSWCKLQVLNFSKVLNVSIKCYYYSSSHSYLLIVFYLHSSWWTAAPFLQWTHEWAVITQLS